MSVRWDAVVDKSNFWTEPSRPSTLPPTAGPSAGAPVAIKVWLYGALASASVERPLDLTLAHGFTVRDVFAELTRRYGDEFRERVIGADGRKFSHCRVFVNGLRVDDLGMPLSAAAAPAVVEIILLAAIEGG